MAVVFVQLVEAVGGCGVGGGGGVCWRRHLNSSRYFGASKFDCDSKYAIIRLNP